MSAVEVMTAWHSAGRRAGSPIRGIAGPWSRGRGALTSVEGALLAPGWAVGAGRGSGGD